MKRTDFIENRIEVIKNVYTLFSYAKSNITEERDWALQRFKLGKWYVVEPFGNMLFFAPSRFVGYKNNTIEKYTKDPGSGIQTNEKFRELKLYKKSDDNYLSEQFKKFMVALGTETDSANFFIPYELDISDLKQPHKCYFICPTHCTGQKENAWKNFLSKNIMAIGWKDVDYTNYTIDEIKKEYIDDSSAITAFTLIKQIRKGDIICCTSNNYGLWGIGIAVSKYKYEQNVHYAGIDENNQKSYYSHYIYVAWICFKKQGYISISELNIQHPENQWPPYGTLSQKEIPQYIYDYLLKNTNEKMEENKYKMYIDLLKANKNLILTGAPGTGKTYMAQNIAEEMGAEYELVQFHPSYDYTDFVEGLRPTPTNSNGNIGFERKDGIFKRFCKKAIRNSKVQNGIDFSFSRFYHELVRDIKSGKIKFVRLRNTDSTELSITSTDSIKWKRTTDDKESTNGVSLYRLLKLYEKYKTVEEVDAIDNIDKSIREVIGGANTSYYWGILREVLQRRETAINDYKKIPPFEYIYNSIVEDVKSGKITSYYTNNGKSYPVKINDKGRIEYREKSPRAEKEENIRLMYEYLIRNNIHDISSYTKDDYWKLISKLSPTTKTIDYIEYGWILQELLNRSSSYNKGLYICETDESVLNYVFIIDEINRGEISKIFGELFFSIDPGYRGEKGMVKTQYQNMIIDKSDPFYNGFYVPENVYIIGTMNDIDRSVESMDFAMRRRFAWEEIKASENTGMLDDLGDMRDEVIDKMNRLNNAIWNEETNKGIEGLNSAYHIGGAYFRKLLLYLNKDYTNKDEAYKHLWENHLHGILFEYLRGTVNAKEDLKELERKYYDLDNDDETEG